MTGGGADAEQGKRFERTDAEAPLCATGIAELVRRGALEGATHVVLRDQWIAEDGLATVLGALDLTRLETLDIAGCGIGSGGAELLARTSALAGLRVLDVAFDYLDAEALRILLSAPHWTNIEALNLSLDGVDVAVADALVRSACAPTLESLTMNECNDLDDAFVTALCERAAFPCLETLSLGWNAITDEAARALARTSRMPALRRLFVEGTRIGPEGIALLRGRGLEVD